MKKRISSRPKNTLNALAPVKRRDERGIAMSILLLFARHRTLSSEQISGLLRIPASTVYRHLQTPLQAGFVVENQLIGRYSAGPEVVRLADNYREEALAQGEVRHRLEQLSQDTGELAGYLVQSSSDVLCVESVTRADILSCSYAAGRSRPLLNRASARAILAFLPEEVRDDILFCRFLPPAEGHAICFYLAAIRARGYSTRRPVLAGFCHHPHPRGGPGL